MATSKPGLISNSAIFQDGGSCPKEDAQVELVGVGAGMVLEQSCLPTSQRKPEGKRLSRPQPESGDTCRKGYNVYLHALFLV